MLGRIYPHPYRFAQSHFYPTLHWPFPAAQPLELRRPRQICG